MTATRARCPCWWSTGTAPTARRAGGRQHGFQTGTAPLVRPPGRVCPGQPEQIEHHEVGRPLLRRPGRPGTASGQPVLRSLEGKTKVRRPAVSRTTTTSSPSHRGRVRQPHGPGCDLRKRRSQFRAAPGAQPYLADVDGGGRPAPVLLRTLPCLMRRGRFETAEAGLVVRVGTSGPRRIARPDGGAARRAPGRTQLHAQFDHRPRSRAD